MPAFLPHLLALGAAALGGAAPGAAAPGAAAPASAAPPATVASDHAAGRDEPLAELGRALVPELEALAEWCRDEKLGAARLAAYEALLAWDPDHGPARRALGWRSDRAGGWERARPPSRARDRKGLEAELAARRGAVVTRALEWIEARSAGESPPWTRAALARLLAADPDNVELRARNGQLWVAGPEGSDVGRWARADAARALERLAGRESLVAALREGAPEPERLERSALEPRIASAPVSWSVVLALPGALVAGTVTPRELARIARSVDLTPRVVERALPAAPRADRPARGPWTRQPRLLVVSAPRDRDALIAHVGEGLDARKADLLRRVNTGFLDRRNTIGVWAPGEEDRHEASVRQRVGIYLRDSFGVGSEQGWIWEGVGLLLSGPIAGRKTLLYVRLEPTDRSKSEGGPPPSLDELRRPGVDWLTLARERLRKRPQPNLALLLAKDVNDMDVDDLLLSFALGTFLVDGHAERAPRVLRRIGDGEPAVGVLEGELGWRLPELSGELLLWLEDVRPTAAATAR